MMAGIKISNFPAVTVPLGTDYFPVVQAGVTKKETSNQLASVFGFVGGILLPPHGGTGIANASASTITLGGALTLSGAFTTALTVTGNTSVTLPTSGTLATVAQVNTRFKSIVVQSFVPLGAFTYTPTTGMAFCIVNMSGAGGGGGGVTGDVAKTSAAAGGGAGGYQQFMLTAAQIGASKTGSVGAGGTAGSNAGGTGGNGGDTSFFDWILGGGVGGEGMVASNASQQATGGTPGVLTQGTGATIVGGYGEFGRNGTTVTTVLSLPGSGGNALISFGGYSKPLSISGAYAGVGATGLFSSGGGGAGAFDSATNNVGGVGGQGAVIIVEFIAGA